MTGANLARRIVGGKGDRPEHAPHVKAQDCDCGGLALEERIIRQRVVGSSRAPARKTSFKTKYLARNQRAMMST